MTGLYSLVSLSNGLYFNRILELLNTIINAVILHT